MPTVSEVIEVIETLAPRYLAESWDNVGLQIGRRDVKVKGILFTLDVTIEVVEEAIGKGANLIIAHHPIIFKGVKSICSDNDKGMLYLKLIEQGINVYVAHTNLDNANGGMNDWLAQSLGLQNICVMDVIGTLENGQEYGTGRVGMFENPMTLEELGNLVNDVYITHGVRFVGDKKTRIQKVALCGGSAMDYYESALKHKADVYITGDIKYHQAQDLLAEGLVAIDAGHYIESICKDKLFAIYKEWVKMNEYDIPLYISQVNTDPFVF
ncbi:Nif3-like dinuclear metal center hexameric protein [Carnobacteriaceae bacterium zg-84]|uniref:Nif3-like dinuclear metal center hexameric protein n=1 Tax=Granulicatella sp. zg-84 TaxID=2678503 RepID=UPI0013C263E4|nr:Nif3-like dinuclear metal center hexameric protein [Granulicatella sp. zg-84]NEW65868.1 Nif3-like dinuclear metal center hexameric protein [Granulicatella sp. zg-84]QMI86405.1 Nif3-like dinuclear metal center hexameric protein [Carnobacteriaceae bacterium zg-84]